jgi:predicted small secreted protein
MLRMLVVVVVAAAVVLASCATPYADQGLLADVSRVKFQGNGLHHPRERSGLLALSLR